MYSFLDQPIAALPVADRLLMDGLRNWALARALGRDTLAAIAARAPDTDAAALLDEAMGLIDDSGTAPLMLQRPCHNVVEEDEAVLLGIVRLAGSGEMARAATALGHLVRPEAAMPIALLLADAARLSDASLPVRR